MPGIAPGTSITARSNTSEVPVVRVFLVVVGDNRKLKKIILGSNLNFKENKKG